MAAYEEIGRAIDAVYIAHKANYTTEHRAAAIAEVLNEVILALPRWMDSCLWHDALEIVHKSHPDLLDLLKGGK